MAKSMVHNTVWTFASILAVVLPKEKWVHPSGWLFNFNFWLVLTFCQMTQIILNLFQSLEDIEEKPWAIHQSRLPLQLICQSFKHGNFSWLMFLFGQILIVILFLKPCCILTIFRTLVPVVLMQVILNVFSPSWSCLKPTPNLQIGKATHSKFWVSFVLKL